MARMLDAVPRKPTSSRAPSSAVPHRPGNSRRVVCALLFATATAASIDSVLLGNLAPELHRRIGWTPDQYWYVMAAFSAAGAASVLVSGRILGRLGLRWTFALACGFCAVLTAGHALANSVAGFLILRILLGFGHGANSPAANEAIARWFPRTEWAVAGRFVRSGFPLGAALTALGLPLLIAAFSTFALSGRALGWRGAFLAAAGFDIATLAGWQVLYRRLDRPGCYAPPDGAGANLDERKAHGEPGLRDVLSCGRWWVLAAVNFVTQSFWCFLLFGAPSFFADHFKLALSSRSLPLALVFFCAASGGFLAARLFSGLMKLGCQRTRARELALLFLALAVAPVFFAASTAHLWLAVALIALAAAAYQGWSAQIAGLILESAPYRMTKTLLTLGDFSGWAGASVLFLILALLRQTAFTRVDSGDYRLVFLGASLSCLAGLLMLHFLAPRTGREGIDRS